MGWLTDIVAGYVAPAASKVGDLFGKAWDFGSKNSNVVAGVVGAAGGVAKYLGGQDELDMRREEMTANQYAVKSKEAQVARHNEGIAKLAQEYREGTRPGLLRGGTS